MQKDFHYYATYSAARLAGYTHEDAMQICYADQMVDCCTRTMLRRVGGPMDAATTQLQLELADARTDIIGLQDITRIWASFHFLPYDLKAEPKKKCTRRYLRKYRLLCDVNGNLVVDTVNLAKGSSLQAAGLAMHVLADTWAHRYFAGTPSLVLNNPSRFYDLDQDKEIKFTHNPKSSDDLDEGKYTNCIYQSGERSIMNLGHGRAGHIPDYSFIRYSFMPSWADYEILTKDNPEEYYKAFTQMICALKFLRGETDEFCKDTYDEAAAEPYREVIMAILRERQADASAHWKRFGENLSRREIEDFDEFKYDEEYKSAPEDSKNETVLGKFFLAATKQKSMVSESIFQSGSKLAGIGGKRER